MYLFSGLEIFDSSERRRSDDDSSRRYVGAGGGAGLQRGKSGRFSYLFIPAAFTERRRDRKKSGVFAQVLATACR